MKVLIQIPCLNEAEALPVTLAALPRELPGVDVVEWLIVDDGSHDGTAEIARELGAHHVVRLEHNQGLAKAFATGLESCLALGADIIVNTDADNQYEGQDIEKLVQPLLEGKADLVIGERTGAGFEGFSAGKKFFQRLGSRVVGIAAGIPVRDAPSGFRAMNRRSALHFNLFTKFTYTTETLIQAGQKNLKVLFVPIRTNLPLRPSRLFKNHVIYVRRSVVDIVHLYILYNPIRFFGTIGATLMILGSIGIARFLWFYFLIGDGSGKIQSLVISGMLVGIGFQSVLFALLAGLIGTNRKMLEDLLFRTKQGQFKQPPKPPEAPHEKKEPASDD